MKQKGGRASWDKDGMGMKLGPLSCYLSKSQAIRGPTIPQQASRQQLNSTAASSNVKRSPLLQSRSLHSGSRLIQEERSMEYYDQQRKERDITPWEDVTSLQNIVEDESQLVEISARVVAKLPIPSSILIYIVSFNTNSFVKGIQDKGNRQHVNPEQSVVIPARKQQVSPNRCFSERGRSAQYITFSQVQSSKSNPKSQSPKRGTIMQPAGDRMPLHRSGRRKSRSELFIERMEHDSRTRHFKQMLFEQEKRERELKELQRPQFLVELGDLRKASQAKLFDRFHLEYRRLQKEQQPPFSITKANIIGQSRYYGEGVEIVRAVDTPWGQTLKDLREPDLAGFTFGFKEIVLAKKTLNPCHLKPTESPSPARSIDEEF